MTPSELENKWREEAERITFAVSNPATKRKVFVTGYLAGRRAAHEEQRWISVEERLPDIELMEFSNVSVLVAWGPNEGNVGSMRYECCKVRGELKKRWMWNGRISPFDVTHWMPLPNPPVKP